LLDVVQLADINAALGHSVGDRLLREVARRIRTKAPPGALVARGGSKQFLIMLPNCDADAAGLLSEELLHEVQLPIAAADIPIRLNARCGLALFPLHGLTAEDLLRRADLALLQARQSEISIALFNPNTETGHQRRIQVLGELQRGIEAGQLSLAYQPKMDLRTRAIVSCEVLVRWQHPVYGNVPPSEFIPYAEHTGSIRQLTTWVLNTALAQLAAWNRAGTNIAARCRVARIRESGRAAQFSTGCPRPIAKPFRDQS